MPTSTKTKKTTRSKAKKTAQPKLVLNVYRETFNVSVTQHGPKKFAWWAQQSFDYFSGDEFQEGDLNERGEAKTLQHATQAAFDALADHLDIE